MEQLNNIINGGYCIGCGVCAAITDGRIKIVENESQHYQASALNVNEIDIKNSLAVCPFSNEGMNEDEISNKAFDISLGNVSEVIGYYQSLYAGHISDTNTRLKCSSGGIITFVLSQLIQNNIVDAVIHVKNVSEPGMLFNYGVSFTVEEVLSGSKSRYYPVELSQVLDYVKQNDLRYAITGLPCFIKAIRKYCIQDPVIEKRIKFFIGLVCGHLKSKAFAELIGYQSGIMPEKLCEIDFRYKLSDRPADNYGIFVKGIDGNQKIMVARETMGTNWGQGFFKYEACDYCDDIFSETADIAVGDAWIEPYTKDYKGNSIVIVRNSIIDDIIREGIKSGMLVLDIFSSEQIRQSQGGGFRHRRSGLGYRLYLKRKKGQWAPNKRVPIDKNGLSKMRKVIYVFRVYLREKSIEYWKFSKNSGNYDTFIKKIKVPSYLYGLLLKIQKTVKKS